jgi:hypothetical protein
MQTATTPVSIALAARYGLGARVDVLPRWGGRALCVHAPIRDGVPTPTRGVWVIASTEFGYAAGTYRGPLSAAVKLARLWDAAFGDALATAPRVGAGVPSLSAWHQARAWSRQLNGDAPATGPVSVEHDDYRRDTDAPDNGRRVGAPTLPELRADAAAGRPVSLAALARAKHRDAATAEPQRREPVAAADGDGAEQYPAAPTLTPGTAPRTVRYSRRLPDGRERLRDPETGRAVRMNGDVAAFRGPDPLTPRLRLWFGDRWHDVPTIAELMAWSLDGVAETPDGSRVEPDAPNSWLTLLGVV